MVSDFTHSISRVAVAVHRRDDVIDKAVFVDGFLIHPLAGRCAPHRALHRDAGVLVLSAVPIPFVITGFLPHVAGILSIAIDVATTSQIMPHLERREVLIRAGLEVQSNVGLDYRVAVVTVDRGMTIEADIVGAVEVRCVEPVVVGLRRHDRAVRVEGHCRAREREHGSGGREKLLHLLKAHRWRRERNENSGGDKLEHWIFLSAVCRLVAADKFVVDPAFLDPLHAALGLFPHLDVVP